MSELNAAAIATAILLEEYGLSPEDAPNLYGKALSTGRLVMALLHPALERARREERERCAKVMDAEAAFSRENHDVITDEEDSHWGNDIKIRYHWRMRAELAERAAAAIRKG